MLNPAHSLIDRSGKGPRLVSEEFGLIISAGIAAQLMATKGAALRGPKSSSPGDFFTGTRLPHD